MRDVGLANDFNHPEFRSSKLALGKKYLPLDFKQKNPLTWAS